jgi:DNA-binding IclR family transcriptional regulator
MKTQSIEKALKILLAFAPQNGEKGTVEISQQLDMNKATVSRIVNTLNDYGFLSRSPQTKKFQLGPSIVNLGLAVRHSIDRKLVLIASPLIDQLRDKLNETVVFNTLSGNNVIISYIADSPKIFRANVEIGMMGPTHATASGKAIFSFMPQDAVVELLRRKLHRFTPNTITDPEKLKSHFHQIRKQGYAFDNEEIEEGYRAVAAPVFNFEGRPIAAVGVVGISQTPGKGEDATTILLLKETAEKISTRLSSVESPMDTEKAG